MNSALHAAGGAGPAGSAHQASCTHGSAQEVQSAPVRSLPTRAVKIILLPVPGSFPPLPSDAQHEQPRSTNSGGMAQPAAVLTATAEHRR